MKPGISFAFGILIGCLATLGVVGAIRFTHELDKWGRVRVYYDEPARAEIIRQGFSLPSSVTDTYYYIDGFQDHTIYIAFSGPLEVLDKVIFDKTGKKVTELTRWQGQVTENDYYGPGAMGPQYRTMFYNLNKVKHGYYLDNGKPRGELSEYWYLVYDRENGRVYYCWWNS